MADRLAEAIEGACIFLDDFIKPEREWRWRDRPWDYRTGERVGFDGVVRRDGPVIVEGVSALHPDLAAL